jgi:hypothetical protein
MTKRKVAVKEEVIESVGVVETPITPVIEPEVKRVVAFPEVHACLQIGQRVWRRVNVLDTYKLVNTCNRIIAIDEKAVNTEFLYALVGPEKATVLDVVDCDGVKWNRSVNHSFDLETLKKHIAKTTNNIWWESLDI